MALKNINKHRLSCQCYKIWTEEKINEIKKKKKEVNLWCHNNTLVRKQLLLFLFLSFFIWKTTISSRIIRLLFCQYNNQCRLRRFAHFLWNGLKNVGNLKSFGKLFKWVSSDWRERTAMSFSFVMKQSHFSNAMWTIHSPKYIMTKWVNRTLGIKFIKKDEGTSFYKLLWNP